MCPTLLDKFKEKNTAVCSNAAEALTAMHRHCFALADVAEDFSAALEHKNPKVGLRWAPALPQKTFCAEMSGCF